MEEFIQVFETMALATVCVFYAAAPDVWLTRQRTAFLPQAEDEEVVMK
ncbi:MAG: hypothetical protein KDE29_03065 [Anaerolineales bacterium]|nr:hypothetical protein [Anaerolineales bacterium]